MWNQNPIYFDSSFKRNPISFNLRPRHPAFHSQRPGPMLQPHINSVPRPLQRVPFLSPNKRTLANLPATRNNFSNMANSPFATKIDRRNMQNLNSPVFSGCNTSPVFSNHDLDNKSDIDSIPFLSDNSKADSSPVNKSLSAESVAVTSSSGVSADSNSSHKKNETAVSGKVILPTSSLSLYDNLPPPSLSESAVPDTLYEPDHEHVETSAQESNFDLSDERLQTSQPTVSECVNSPASEEPPISTHSPLPFNITKVLGDARMLNDILSVAKTIQFSEQSKSLTFPSCSGKSVAIVQPNNVQTDSTSSLVSSIEPYCKTKESLIPPPPFVPPLLKCWTEDIQKSSSNTASNIFNVNSPQKPDAHELDVQENRLNEATDDSVHLENYVSSQTTFSSSFTDDKQPHGSPDRLLKRPAPEVEAPPTYEPLHKMSKVESDALNDVFDDTPSEKETQPIDSFQPSAPIDHKSTEPMSNADVKSALFAELGKCSITSNEDAETVLEVISSLSEAYLKYKLSFIPEAKFQNLVKGIREGKEKETNFVLGFLNCGTTNSEEAPPPLPTDDVRPPLPDNSGTVEHKATSTVEHSASSSSVPRLKPFIPMYTSGNVSMPVNYWMATSSNSMASTSYPPLQPPLPPPLLAPMPLMQPPLPPLPPQQLAPPPLPFTDVPLPPPD